MGDKLVEWMRVGPPFGRFSISVDKCHAIPTQTSGIEVPHAPLLVWKVSNFPSQIWLTPLHESLYSDRWKCYLWSCQSFTHSRTWHLPYLRSSWPDCSYYPHWFCFHWCCQRSLESHLRASLVSVVARVDSIKYLYSLRRLGSHEGLLIVHPLASRLLYQTF